MIEIKFPADNKPLAAAIGSALTQYAGAVPTPAPVLEETRAAAVRILETSEPEPEEVAVDAEPESEAEVSATDKHGVPFDANYCSSAADPFYATGSMRGRWKRKRGVSEGDYESWYAAHTPAVEEPEIEAAQAFSGEPAAPEMNSAGDLMKWVAEMQAADKITQTDVEAAYAKHGYSLPDLFGPNAPEVIAALVGELSQ